MSGDKSIPFPHCHYTQNIHSQKKEKKKPKNDNQYIVYMRTVLLQVVFKERVEKSFDTLSYTENQQHLKSSH